MSGGNNQPLSPRRPWMHGLLLIAIALGFRLWFVEVGVVDNPIRGDALGYSSYAWNLVHHGVFSIAAPHSDTVAPDSFRDPAYPALLAMLMKGFGSGDAWYHAVLRLQAVLGTITVMVVYLIALRMMPARWALAGGLMAAVWPHSVASCGFMLTETSFGFMCALALWLLLKACESKRGRDGLGAGLALGAGSLINATLSPFGVVLAILAWRQRWLSRSGIALLLLGSLLPLAIWAMRSHGLPYEQSSQARAVINLIQGSWPEYHEAYHELLDGLPSGREKLDRIEAEQTLATQSRTAALASLLERIRQAPGRYAAWYASKPFLLWDWDIRMGFGDVYPYPMQLAPYAANPFAYVLETLCKRANPVLFGLMLLGMAASCGGRAPTAVRVVTALLAYETLVYWIMQSEPRYSTPFRGMEMVLALYGVLAAAHAVRARQRARRETAGEPR